MHMLITSHERSEWSRMSDAAIRAGHVSIGIEFMLAASTPAQTMPLSDWDALQRAYRKWLCFNEYPNATPDYAPL